MAWAQHGVRLRLVNADGTPRAAETRVIAERADGFPVDLNPTITVLSDGRIVVAAQGDTVGSDIWHKIVDPRGAAIPGGPGADDLLGNALVNQMSGFGGNDRLSGLAGNDTLDGGPGDDTMVGGTGDDRYRVGAKGNIVIESAGSGFDTVEASVNVALPAHVEALVLAGKARQGTRNSGDHAIDGNARANVLRGLGGNDSLRGADGDDRLIGGAGRATASRAGRATMR